MKNQCAGAVVFLYVALTASGQNLPAIHVPDAGGSYVDPVSRHKIWRVTDAKLCQAGGRHYYSYWPVWNQSGTHLIVECSGWRGGATTALLIRDEDLKVLGDVFAGAPGGLQTGRIFWSWTNPRVFYAYRSQEIWKWDPFQRKGAKIAEFTGKTSGGISIQHARLAYVSFDDRYLLVELQGKDPKNPKSNEWDAVGLLTYDMQEKKKVGELDVTQFQFYDEAVFTRDNFVWVIADTGREHSEAFRYSLDFANRTRPSEGAHHAHGLLPDGTPVDVQSASNRDCPQGSPSGNPYDKDYPKFGWKPTAMIVDERVDSLQAARNDAIPSILFKLGCTMRGQHLFTHFSWNNVQKDQFFLETETYHLEGDSLANGLFRVTLQFDASGKIQGDRFDLLANHRSNAKLDYWGQPRMTCNQQGTRCLFSSLMNVATDNLRPRADVYVVDVVSSTVGNPK